MRARYPVSTHLILKPQVIALNNDRAASQKWIAVLHHQIHYALVGKELKHAVAGEHYKAALAHRQASGSD